MDMDTHVVRVTADTEGDTLCALTVMPDREQAEYSNVQSRSLTATEAAAPETVAVTEAEAVPGAAVTEAEAEATAAEAQTTGHDTGPSLTTVGSLLG